MRSFSLLIAGLGLVLVGLVSLTSHAFADDIGLTRVDLREGSDGSIELLVRAPAAQASAFGAPSTQDGRIFETDGFVPSRGGGGALRFRLPDGALNSGDTLYLPWARQGVLLVAELNDGRLARNVFLREGKDIEVPISILKPQRVSMWERARDAVLDGVRHMGTSFLHVAFLLALCLAAPGRRGLRFVTWFLSGQVLGVLASWGSDSAFPAPSGELSLLLASIFLAIGTATRRSTRALGVILLIAGVSHGAGVGGALGERVAQILGQDAVLLVAVALASWLFRSPRRKRRLRVSAVLCLGLGSLALLLLWVVESPLAHSLDANLVAPGSGPLEPLPGGGSGPARREAPAPPVAAPLPAVPLQTFVVIEPFVVRQEILLRLDAFDELPIDAAHVGGETEIPVSEQGGLNAWLRDRLLSRFELRIDDQVAKPADVKVGFVTSGPTGTLFRAEPVPERVKTAQFALALTVPTASLPQELSIAWRFSEEDPAVADVRAVMVDPERTQQQLLTPERTQLKWRNELTFDPVPRIDSARVSPVTLQVPVLALPLLLLAGILLWRMRKAPMLDWRVGGFRLCLALALLLAPVLVMALPLPFVGPPTPSPTEAERLVGQLLSNVYRSFVFQEEEAIYDQLALSVTGEKLAQVYLENGKALEVADQGGAQARVEAVEVLSASELEATEGGFEAVCEWTVAGSVSHFGHRHYRQNRYRARIEVRAEGGAWKIVALEVLEQERML